ncbi:MAG TPA: chromate transporter [Spirochaetia bacterium]|nr:chromate transporter [Spirochaetia bacterium]
MPLVTLAELAWSFFRVGLFGFGGGFAMIPLMQKYAVNEYHWLTLKQFSAAIALGQITPGPVAISATFIGYRAAGVAGAVVATVAVFAPSFLAMYLLARFYLQVRANPVTQGIMHGVLPVIVALILSVAISLNQEAVTYVWQGLVLALTAVLAVKNRIPYGFLILGSMVTGIIITLAGRHF